jgi:hypothetical protein
MWLQFKKLLLGRDKKEKKAQKTELRNKITKLTDDDWFEMIEPSKPVRLKKKKKFTDWIYFLKWKAKSQDQHMRELTKLMSAHLHWPMCTICNEAYATYNMYKCKQCQDAIDRLRKR